MALVEIFDADGSISYVGVDNPLPTTGGGGGGGSNRAVVVTTYTVKTAFTGASVGDVITYTQVLNITTSTPTTVATVWRNQTTDTDLSTDPSFADLALEGTTGLTDAQLRASAVAISALSLPLPTGASTSALQTAGNASLSSMDSKMPALDNNRQPVLPSMVSGGNIAVTTAATGTNYTAFASQACKQLTLSNQSGVVVEVRQGAAGVALQIPTSAFYTFFGLTNTNQLDVRRTDVSNTQITLTARWEA